MNRVRTPLVLVAAAALFSLLVWGLGDLPGVGEYAGPYGDVIIRAARNERHVLNAVAAVNFDYRGFDTLGEEFIFFASVIGVALLLRDENEDQRASTRRLLPRSTNDPRRWMPAEPVSLVSLPAVGALLVFGGYIVLQGHLSPGGGFQGGIVISAVALLVALSGGAAALYRTLPLAVLEFVEALGIGSYLAIGFCGVAAGRPYLTNVLPLGETGNLLSSGTIWAINFGVGVAVAAGFMLLTIEFVEPLHRARYRRHQ
ncbi:MAG TPA: MnhB domain-containing protein [Pirellulales bacterium]|nr:MnhB domain-containing protein [Pirellulales bacterium]